MSSPPTFASLRRRGGPAALITCVAFVAGLVPPRRAHAEEGAGEERPAAEVSRQVATAEGPELAPPPEVDRPQTPTEPLAVTGADVVDVGAASGLVTKGAAKAVVLAVSGSDKTGVSSQAIAVPQGAGKIQGMGESFSAQLSTGIASLAVPLQLVPARGKADPALGLSYSSSAGHGVAGVGWDVDWPSISRQTDRGIPTYRDTAAWQPNQDRFIFGAGQELVPICIVTGTACAGALAGEAMPAWASGWQYFRSRVEGSYERFFWSPDHRTWRVQSKSGQQMELGVPLDGSGYALGLETDPTTSNIFKWNVVRQYDAYGATDTVAPAPANPVVYRYLQDGGTAYLSDIYDTSPLASSTATSDAALPTYAHHTHLVYAPRPDVTQSYRRGWLVSQGQRLAGIDVTSKPFSNAVASPRAVVRRYHLAYDPSFHVSLLTSVQMEGRCVSNVVENSAGVLPAVTGCPTLPAMTFGYQHVSPYNGDGTPGVVDLEGYEGFDDRTIAMTASPNHSVDEADADMFDLNSDGLPDMLVTMPGLYAGNDGVFYNGTSGTVGSFTAGTMPVVGALGATASDITLSNQNVLACDLTGDGTIDLLHQPAPLTYAVYTPTLQPGGAYSLVGRAIPQAALQDPHLDLGSDTPDINVMDVNGDGLVDVVRATGTEMDTFYALGRYPNGDGNFGSATWAGPYSSNLSLAAVTSCVPWDGVPVKFSDSTIQIADMNGDGLPDIVRVEQGNLHYWPGRGNGVWGTGSTDACQPGNFSEGTFVAMTNSPEFADPSGTGVRIDDINGDGLDDVIEVNFGVVNIWLNVDGVGFTPAPHVTSGFTPASGPEWLGKVRIIDMNGSGLRDIFWGEAGSFRYIDVAGGQRPWVLTHVENGLGKTTDLEYSTSAGLMQAAAAARQPWTSFVPIPVHVVTQVTDRDNLGLAGRPAGVYVTQYSYANPVYDGRQREFRGFQQAWTTKLGDVNGPTSTTLSTFLLGQCADDDAPPPGVSSRCLPSTRWTDNTQEALKGLPLVSETSDETGVYASSTHHQYTLRRLYTGLDGREVRAAFESTTDQYAYDTSPFVAGTTTATLTDVVPDLQGATAQPGYVAPTTKLAVRGASEAHTQSSSVVDLFGNSTQQTSFGCIDCSPADSPIVTHTVPWISSADPGAWVWGPRHSWTDGPSGALKEFYYAEDVGGSLEVTQPYLTGTLPLMRSNASGGATAPVPTPASKDGALWFYLTEYDGFGNPTITAPPIGGCRVTDFDYTYGDVVVDELVAVGAAAPNGCGSVAAITYATYDRGLQLPTEVLGVHGEITLATYDGFGRTSTVTKPDPNNLGSPSPIATVMIQYYVPADAELQPYTAIETLTQDGSDPSVAQYRATWSYTDGLGRTIVTIDQADTSAGDLQPWIAGGLPTYDAKGEALAAYLPEFWAGPPGPTSFLRTPASAFTHQVYDAFGRVTQGYALDGTQVLQTSYHALSKDVWDGEDLNVAGAHYGTYVTTRSDGHGRPVSQVERVHVPVTNAIETHDTETTYLQTGWPTQIQRTSSSGGSVTRWMQYDSLGRMVLNAEPDTSIGFTPTVGNTAGLLSWRYAYNDNGQLVGTSDARGCGVNYFYDAGLRPLAEDYSPCLASQPAYSPPDLTTGDGTEVFYWYDTLDAQLTADPVVEASSGAEAADAGGCLIQSNLLKGRLVAVSDRGSKTVTGYDGRGRSQCAARQIAAPGTPSATLASRYAPRVYAQNITFDAADRPVTATTGAQVVLDGLGESIVTTSYSRRGAVDRVTSGYGDLIASIARAADGPVTTVTYGDLAATSTAFTYDLRRRVSTVQTTRGPPATWPAGGTPTVYQHTLESASFQYDLADNPVQIADLRNPAEWPAGAQPVNRSVVYDDLYRATSITYASPMGAGPDAWVDPFLAEDTETTTDPRLAQPSPHASFTSRVQSQTVAYDWLGNTTQSGDDVGGFYDRSLGTITNGGTGAGPYQLTSAVGGTSPRQGSLVTAYDGAGNLTGMSVARPNASCVPTGAVCSQRYAYDWDEVGRLMRARRWDGASLGAPTTALPSATPAVDLGYAYDMSDSRTLKTATDALGNQVNTVYVYDDLELRRAAWSGTDYDDTVDTEVPYLFAHGVRLGRVEYSTTDPSPDTHLILELADQLGSTTIAIDQGTSELVERGTYLGYGGADSDYRPSTWGGFREDYRFTGKEEDVEVGLDYFGKRFYAPLLGRWISADPLAVQSPGSADLNVYAYVHGSVLRDTDPTGLDDPRDPQQGGEGTPDVHVAAPTAGAPSPENPPEGAVTLGDQTSAPPGSSTSNVITPGDVAAALAKPIAEALGDADPPIRDGGAERPGHPIGQPRSSMAASGTAAAALAAGPYLDRMAGRVAAGILGRGAAAGAGSISAALEGRIEAGFRPGTLELPPCPCFSAETVVETCDGEAAIASLHAGDSVLARDVETGETSCRHVVRTFTHNSEQSVDLAILLGDRVEHIHTTFGHPFRSKDRGWVSAGALGIGEALVTLQHEDATVIGLSDDPDGVVYNLEVEEDHTYFVRTGGVWVHNSCCDAAEAAPGALRFSQTTASAAFSADGVFAGKTIGSLAGELRAGRAVGDVPVGVVDGLIVNTRSSLALMRAGIPQANWVLIDSTESEGANIADRLLRNGLGPEGTPTLRITGLGSGASSLE